MGELFYTFTLNYFYAIYFHCTFIIIIKRKKKTTKYKRIKSLLLLKIPIVSNIFIEPNESEFLEKGIAQFIMSLYTLFWIFLHMIY